jgi:hypothetical protein
VAKATESSPSWLRAGTDQLLRMRTAELDEVFSMSPAGEIPTGRARGTVLFATGTPVARLVAKLAYLLAWRGKVFDQERGDLRNIVSPFGVRAIRAKVYRDSSWTDGHDCIVLDYSETSLVARWIRDEIREVAPGVYLGQVFWSKAKILKFALVFPS